MKSADCGLLHRVMERLGSCATDEDAADELRIGRGLAAEILRGVDLSEGWIGMGPDEAAEMLVQAQPGCVAARIVVADAIRAADAEREAMDHQRSISSW